MSVIKNYEFRAGNQPQAIEMGEFQEDSDEYHEVVNFLCKYWGSETIMAGAPPMQDFTWSFYQNHFYLAVQGTWLQAKQGMMLIRVGRDVNLVPQATFTKVYEERVYEEATPAADSVAVLDTMLDLQRDVESGWGRLPDPEDAAAVSTYLREVILCATDELHEVLAEVHWKPWKQSRGIKDVAAYREEVADVMHFILDLYLAAGLTGKDIYQDYVAKHNINIDRTTNSQYKEG